jgi:ABC-2 type transport system permease protein/oleandomycin transport system permease protein
MAHTVDEVLLTPADDHAVASGPIWLLRDSWTEAIRHLRAVPRNPELLMFATIQPIMFIVLFVYVFAGSIDVPGYENYKQFVVPGIFAQTVLFNSAFTGVGLADDLNKGIIDRLRSLPMYQSAVLVGRTFSDVVRNVITFAVMLAVGFAVGFRIEGTMAEAVAATLLLLAFSYAFSWIQALVGLSAGSVEAANSAGFIWMFPLTFVSSASSTRRPCRAGSSPSPSTTRSRSSPTPPARSTTARAPATTPGSRWPGRSGSRSCSPGYRPASSPPAPSSSRRAGASRGVAGQWPSRWRGENGHSSKCRQRPSPSSSITHRSRQRESPAAP